MIHSSKRRIPIKISPFFWLMAGLIGWINSKNLLLTLIWIFVIFISILVHEFGHALTLRFFKRSPRIEIVAFGGLTYQEGTRLRGWREFLVVLNGPLAGFLLYFASLFLLEQGVFSGQFMKITLSIFIFVNLFWSFLNLLPVMPLDGGQLLRVICESISKTKGLRASLFLSTLFSALIACYFLLFLSGRGLLPGIIFLLFTFQNFVSWRQARFMTDQDQNDDLASRLKEVEKLIASHQRGEAAIQLEEIRKKARKGLIFTTATQHLAALRAQENNYFEVYKLLNPIKKHLSGELFMYLHQGAYEMKDYPLVFELAGETFQLFPNSDVALKNAEASAFMKLVEPTIGWLKAARKCGVSDLKTIVEKEIFSSVRELPSFQSFLKRRGNSQPL